MPRRQIPRQDGVDFHLPGYGTLRRDKEDSEHVKVEKRVPGDKVQCYATWFREVTYSVLPRKEVHYRGKMRTERMDSWKTEQQLMKLNSTELTLK